MLSKVFSGVARTYQGMVSKRLAAVGLKYDDLMIEGGDLDKALSRTDASTVVDRQRRIKQAFDLSAKRKQVPDHMRTNDAMDFYIHDAMEAAVLEREERAALNKY